jgi:hypothetical protein
LEEADEEKCEVEQTEDRDTADNDIALPTLANPIKVSGDRQFDENLIHDKQDTVTNGELFQSVRERKQASESPALIILG